MICIGEIVVEDMIQMHVVLGEVHALPKIQMTAESDTVHWRINFMPTPRWHNSVKTHECHLNDILRGTHSTAPLTSRALNRLPSDFFLSKPLSMCSLHCPLCVLVWSFTSHKPHILEPDKI